MGGPSRLLRWNTSVGAGVAPAVTPAVAFPASQPVSGAAAARDATLVAEEAEAGAAGAEGETGADADADAGAGAGRVPARDRQLHSLFSPGGRGGNGGRLSRTTVFCRSPAERPGFRRTPSIGRTE